MKKHFSLQETYNNLLEIEHNKAEYIFGIMAAGSLLLTQLISARVYRLIDFIPR